MHVISLPDTYTSNMEFLAVISCNYCEGVDGWHCSLDVLYDSNGFDLIATLDMLQQMTDPSY